MDAAYAQKYDNDDYVVNSKLKREYSIVYDGGNFNSNGYNCSIPVKSRREVELLLLSLREEASVIMDEQERRLCNIWDWLYGRTYSDIFTNLNWSYRDENEVIDIIKRIPLPKTLNENLKIHHEEPERINQVYVHKHNRENVLISRPYHYGNMFYFNGFKKSSEFNIEHGSDHLEKIIIFEAARQAGIATLHLAGVPLFYGKIVLLKTNIQYKNFIERSESYLIQTIPVARHKGGLIFVIFNILQEGNSCATGYFSLSFQKNASSSSSNWGQMFENNENVMNTITT
jgi:hypothetical protein